MVMIPLYTEQEYLNAKSNDKLPCKCEKCSAIFFKNKKEIKSHLKGNKNHSIKYCSRQCFHSSQIVKLELFCTNCNKNFYKYPSQARSKNHFCSQSCAATYNNKNKSTGTRRSKLEIYLEHKLTELYPNLHIDFNKKDTIGSELDIYIPSLKLAFELNGIFHFEPIYGIDKLNQIQNNDTNKFQKCQELGISLCMIDTSSQKYFKEQTSLKFLNIITDVIDKI